MQAKTYKALSVLLLYPDKQTQGVLDNVFFVIKEENLLSQEDNTNIYKFIKYLKSTNLLKLQEQYVNTFDRQKHLSLHLFEHVYADSSDRGPAMIDLQEVYENNNLNMQYGELPDFLPLFLEYLSTINYQQAAKLLSEPINIISSMSKRLQLQGSLYYFIFNSLKNLSILNNKPRIIKKNI